MNCIEKVINISIVKDMFNAALQKGHLQDILNEIIKQSKVEFNYEDSTD